MESLSPCCFETERPLKVMKNAFYFTLKALFVLKMFKFLTGVFVYVYKRLDQKDIVSPHSLSRNCFQIKISFKIGLSCLISKLSLISRSNCIFWFVKIVNSSKDGIFKSQRKLSNVFRFKDRLPSDLVFGVVY